MSKCTVGIYKLTSPSGKVYIGQSWNIERRFNKDYKYACNLKHQSLLYNSLIKYGCENHKKEIIHELPKNTTQETLNYWEKFYWKQYVDARIKVLNLKEPGSNGKHSEETVEKLRKVNKGKSIHGNTRRALILSNIGRVKSEEERRKIGAAHKGVSPTQEVRDKIRNSLLLLNLPSNNRKVLMFDLEGNLIEEFRNTKDINKKRGWDTKYIRDILKNRNNAKSYKGYTFKYKDQC